jgi:hypothetical protein
MALDPFVAQLWWNANADDPGDPNGWGKIEAFRLLAERLGVPYAPNDPGFRGQIESAVVKAGETPGAPGSSQQTPGTPGAPASDGLTTRNRALFDQMAQYLTESELGDLWTVDSSGNPGGWLWEQIVNGIDSAAVLQVRLEDTDAFKRNYGVISEMRKKAASGEAVLVPTVAQVRDYRVTVRSVLRNAGLPQWFYDENADADRLMTEGLSPSEVEQRLGRAWTQVQDADPAIRAMFGQFYGIADGEGALAAFFLDPEKTAGRGSTLGLDVSRQVAERVASSSLSEGGIEAGLADAAALVPLTVESFGESGEDITEGDAVTGTLLGDAQARQRLERRRIERQAVDRQAAGGAALTSRGVTGLS